MTNYGAHVANIRGECYNIQGRTDNYYGRVTNDAGVVFNQGGLVQNSKGFSPHHPHRALQPLPPRALACGQPLSNDAALTCLAPVSGMCRTTQARSTTFTARYFCSLSLSLSLSHTHTHTHTFSLSLSFSPSLSPSLSLPLSLSFSLPLSDGGELLSRGRRRCSRPGTTAFSSLGRQTGCEPPPHTRPEQMAQRGFRLSS